MKLAAMLALGLYISSAAFALSVASCQMTQKKQIVKEVDKHDSLPVGGYLSSVNTPTYTNDRTQRILLDFNQLGGGEAVIWGGESVFGSLLDRQITIRETDKCEFEKDNELHNCVGLATCGMVKCEIVVKKGMEPLEYRQVLLHEYMHCMGYDDLREDKDIHDLMYYEENDAPEINIHYYAEMAAERQQIWKSLKNLSSNTKPTK